MRPRLNVFSDHLVYIRNCMGLDWRDLKKEFNKKSNRVRFIETFEAWLGQKTGQIVLEFHTRRQLERFLEQREECKFFGQKATCEVLGSGRERKKFFRKISSKTGIDLLACKATPPSGISRSGSKLSKSRSRQISRPHAPSHRRNVSHDRGRSPIRKLQKKGRRREVDQLAFSKLSLRDISEMRGHHPVVRAPSPSSSSSCVTSIGILQRVSFISVQNLPSVFVYEHAIELAKEAGEVESINFVGNNALVQYFTEQDAKKAVRMLNNRVLADKRLKVKLRDSNSNHAAEVEAMELGEDDGNFSRVADAHVRDD